MSEQTTDLPDIHDLISEYRVLKRKLTIAKTKRKDIRVVHQIQDAMTLVRGRAAVQGKVDMLRWA